MVKQADLNILIIDPNQKKNNSLKSTLASIQINHVEYITHFKEVEKALTKQPFHLFIIGDDFEGEKTLEALLFFRNNPKTKNIPCLLHTTFNNPANERALITEGLAGIIRYPTTEPALKRALNNFFRIERSKNLVSMIKSSNFFKEFTSEELKVLSKVALFKHFQAGETILNKGDPAEQFYVLLKGEVEVLIFKKNQPPLHISIEEGNPFGEMSVLDKIPRSACCIAVKNCTVLEIGSQIINDKQFSLRLKIFTQIAFTLAKRIRGMNEKLYEQQIEQTSDSTNSTLDTHALNSTPQELMNDPSIDKVNNVELSKETTDFPDSIKKITSNSSKEIIEKAKEHPKKSSAEKINGEEGEGLEEGEEEKEPQNPYATPTGTAEEIDESVSTQEDYDVLKRKINLRTDFIVAKVPNTLPDIICNKFYSYWTGGKLAKINPHHLWNIKWFTPGTPRLKKTLHLTVFCSEGEKAYQDAFLSLPFSQKVVGLSQTGCAGTFLTTDRDIDRYLNDQELQKSLKLDLEIPIDRTWKGKDSIEFLTHTTEDIREDSLFLVFDDKNGKNTKKVRNKFPDHQIITVVKGIKFDVDDPSTLFTGPEDTLKQEGILVQKNEYENSGFYSGQTLFFPDFSSFYEQTDALKELGYIFGTIGVIAQIGPDYSGITWGSKGGAEDAVKAARALYGMKGAQSVEDLASAINWADN